MATTHTPSADRPVAGALVVTTANGEVTIEFSTAGAVSDGDRRGVVELFEKVLDPIEERVTHIRVRMEHAHDRNRVRPTVLRAVIDFRGAPVRAEVAADTTQAALTALEARLSSQLRHRRERRTALEHRKSTPVPGSWRHGDLAVQRPNYFPRPPEERDVVRHKSVAPGETSIEEALFDLDLMDYDFYLYVDSTTSRDALVHRTTEDGRIRHTVHCVGGPGELSSASCPEGTEIDDHEAPRLTLDEARERLDVGHEPWVFFEDAGSGRGHVLYRRYDGHYGLIVPLDEAD